MKHLNWLAILLALCLFAAFAVVACGGDDDDDSGSSGDDDAADDDAADDDSVANETSCQCSLNCRIAELNCIKNLPADENYEDGWYDCFHELNSCMETCSDDALAYYYNYAQLQNLTEEDHKAAAESCGYDGECYISCWNVWDDWVATQCQDLELSDPSQEKECDIERWEAVISCWDGCL